MSGETKQKTSRESVWKTSLNRSKNSIAMNLKYVFQNKKIWSMISLFFLTSLTLGTIFVPFYISGGMILLISIIVPGLIILGAIGSNLKKSSLYKNVMTLGISRKIFYLSQLISIIIIINVLSAFIWTIVWVLGHFNIFLNGWVWDHAGRLKVNPLAFWTIVPLVYVTNVTAVLVFAVYFLIDSITNDSKTYNMVIAGIFIIGVIFGGTLNSYFAKPYNYHMYDFSIGNGISGIDYYKTSSNGTIYVTENFYNATNQFKDLEVVFNESGLEPNAGLVPNFMFIPTLIFNPFYAVGEFTSCAVTSNMSQDVVWHFTQEIVIVDKLVFTNGIIDIDKMNVIDGIQPFMYSSNEYIPIWSWFMISFDGLTWMWTLVLLQPYLTVISYLSIGAVIRKIKRN